MATWKKILVDGEALTSITAGTGLNGGTITSSGTIDLANTADVDGILNIVEDVLPAGMGAPSKVIYGKVLSVDN
jgi:hypothetical protein